MPLKRPTGKTVGRSAATAALVALFCFVPAILLIQNFGDSSGIQYMSNPASLGPTTSGENYGYATRFYSFGTADVCVAFEFLGLDQSDSSANFGIVVGATGPGVQVIKGYVSEGYTPLLSIVSNSGLSTITIPVPPSYLESQDASRNCAETTPEQYVRGGGFRSLQPVFVLGQPRAFPDDWYELDDTVQVYMCQASQTQDECITGLNQGGSVVSPLMLSESLIATTRDQDLTMTVNVDQQATNPEFRFTLQRSGWFIAYTYLIAVMPFLLMIVLFSAYASKKNDFMAARTVPAVYEIAFGVAATLVAILPLRAVLIPSSLPDLTRLDIVFGTGITLLVALSLAWVFIWKAPGSATTANHGPHAPVPEPGQPPDDQG